MPNSTGWRQHNLSINSETEHLGREQMEEAGRSWDNAPHPLPEARGPHWVLACDASVEPHPTIDMNRLAGDKAAVITDEKQAGGGKFLHRSLPSQGNASGVWRPSLVPFGMGPRGIDTAG